MHQYKLWWNPLYSYWLSIYNQSNQFYFIFFAPVDFALSLYEGLKEAFQGKKKEWKRSQQAFINVLNYEIFQYNPFLKRHLEKKCTHSHIPLNNYQAHLHFPSIRTGVCVYQWHCKTVTPPFH